MTFSIEGPSNAEIDALVASIRTEVETEIQGILTATAAGAVAVISRAYQILVYSAPPGVFGAPKNAGKPLAQAVSLEVEPDGVTVFTSKKEAGYVEFGTGVYATIGPRRPITPKRAKHLAFPYWTLPPDFHGFTIPRANARGSLPAGAQGLVIAKKIQGMQARPVWFNPATLNAIEKILDAEIQRSFPS